MKNLKIYLRGRPLHGLFGAETKVLARRDKKPKLKKGNYYTIKDVVRTYPLRPNCKNLEIELYEIPGRYPGNAFFVDRKCFKEMQESGVLKSLILV